MIAVGPDALPRFVATDLLLPVMLALTIVLGGAIREAFIATAILEILACLIMIWCLLDTRLRPLSVPAIWLLGLVSSGALVCLLQLVPIPYDWWTALPGRSELREAFSSVGLDQASQPISLAPDNTLQGALRSLPALAAFVCAAKLPPKVLAAQLTWAVILAAVLSGCLGLAQTFAGDVPILFPYGAQSHGKAAGVFEVVNHQATLQLMAIPFIALLLGGLKSRFDQGDGYQAMGVLTVACLVVSMAALFLAGSVAGYALAGPVLLVSCALVINREAGPSMVIAAAVAVLGLGALAYVTLTSPLVRGLGVTDFGDGGLSRLTLYEGTLRMIGAYWPVGAGLGAFEAAYPAFENPDTVTASYVSHAHNDYLEIAAELGILGCALLAGIVIWWGVLTVDAWRRPQGGGSGLKRAACIAAGVVLVHSLVDAPARTLAISCLTAVCFGAMSSRQSPQRAGNRTTETDRQAFKHRHLEI